MESGEARNEPAKEDYLCGRRSGDWERSKGFQQDDRKCGVGGQRWRGDKKWRENRCLTSDAAVGRLGTC